MGELHVSANARAETDLAVGLFRGPRQVALVLPAGRRRLTRGRDSRCSPARTLSSSSWTRDRLHLPPFLAVSGARPD